MNVVINKTPRPVGRSSSPEGRIGNRSGVESMFIVLNDETYRPDGQIRGDLIPAIPVGRNVAALVRQCAVRSGVLLTSVRR